MNIEPLNPFLIKYYCSGQAQALLEELIMLETVGSTNDYLISLENSPKIVACFAEQQTAGKGQRGKSWSSPKGQICFSLLSHLDKPLNQIAGLSLVCGIAIVNALREYGIDSPLLQLKWPNDVYFEGKKLAGILVETCTGYLSSSKIVIGVGLNLYSDINFDSLINQPYISLENIIDYKIDRNKVAGMLLSHCLSSIFDFIQFGFEAFSDQWKNYDFLYGKKITLTQSQSVITGIMQGISAKGELLLLDDQNLVHTCINGTVRLA